MGVVKVILPRGLGVKQSTTITLQSSWAIMTFAYVLVLVVGIILLVVGDLSGLLLSAFVVGITLLITGCIMSLYPRIFSIRTLRLPGMFVFSYSSMILLPLPVVFADHPYPARTRFLFGTTTGFLCTLAGIVLAHHFFSNPTGPVQRWLSKPIRSMPNLGQFGVVFLISCFVIFVLYIGQVGVLPIVRAIRGGETNLELALAREDALKLIPGRIRYLYSYLRGFMFPYAMLLFFIMAATVRGLRWKLLFGVSFIGSMLMAAASLAKSPVAANVLMLSFAWLLLRGKTLSLRRLFPIAVATLAFPAFVYLAVYQFDIGSLSNRVFLGIARRIFYSPGRVLFHYFAYFPDYHDFLFGRALPWISKLFQDGPFPITNVIGLYMVPDAPKSISANGAYVGFLWADFGLAGVVIGSFVAGMLLQATQLFILRLPKTAPTLVAQAMAAFQVINLASTSLTDVLLSTYSGIWNPVALTLMLLLLWEGARRRSYVPIAVSRS